MLVKFNFLRNIGKNRSFLIQSQIMFSEHRKGTTIHVIPHVV